MHVRVLIIGSSGILGVPWMLLRAIGVVAEGVAPRLGRDESHIQSLWLVLVLYPRRVPHTARILGM